MSVDPESVVTRVIEGHGGHQAVIEAVERQLAEFNLVWNQDTDRIGRVLRAHLAVEHFVTEYLVAKNPNLGELDKARLSYAQKVELLNSSDRLVAILLPGLRLLGSVRNRMAHRLRVEVTRADENAFLGVQMFQALREALRKGQVPEVPPRDEVESAIRVLEEFAKFAAGMLHSALDPGADIWRNAFSSSQSNNER